MSYCVNCGVKLAPSEKRCPLCGTEVINPREKENVPVRPAYSSEIENYSFKNVNWKYLGNVLSLVLAGIAVLFVICNLITSGKIDWSLYVLISTAYLETFMLFFYLKSFAVSAAVWLLSTELLIGGIAFLSGDVKWFILLVGPFVAEGGILTILAVCLFMNRRIMLIRKISALLLYIAVMLLVMEAHIDVFVSGSISLFWSVFASLPVGCLSLVFFCISFSSRIMEEMRQRLFF